VMARFIAAILIIVLLSGWTDTRGWVRVDRASPPKPYDFVVHVSNIPKIKYNPLVVEDRHRMALDLVRRECPKGRIVGDDIIPTEIWGLTSSLPDYVVLVACGNSEALSRERKRSDRAAVDEAGLLPRLIQLSNSHELL